MTVIGRDTADREHKVHLVWLVDGAGRYAVEEASTVSLQYAAVRAFAASRAPG